MARSIIPRVKLVLSLSSTLYLIALAVRLALNRANRHALLALLSPTQHPLRAAALAATLILNAKSLPLAWHARVWGSMLRQLYLQPSPLPRDALFRPIVTEAQYTSLPETDYNAHKSNSVYFADFDVSRTQLVSCLLRKGILEAGQRGKGRPKEAVDEAALTEDEKKIASTPGHYMIALGGVSCNFKRELPPYVPFEIWSRVLSWDNKWVYLVSHMVKAGAVKPDGWALQPWKKRKLPTAAQRSQENANTANGEAMKPGGGSRSVAEKEDNLFKDAIYATSISKYVVKKGRLTIPPESVLRRSDLLPPRPDPADTTDAAENDPQAWTWENVERERARGYELAGSFAMLDGLLNEFPVSGMAATGNEGKASTARPRIDVLGEYGDLLW